MTTLSEILEPTTLKQLIADGYIRERFHPDDDSLRILNYAEKAQYERNWTHETKTCRGLIVRGEEIVARSWPKFFNYGEHEEGSLDLAVEVEVTDKADGSLGILYMAPDGDWAISTRGSFASEQAIHATQLFRDRYLNQWNPTVGVTYLFEIVFPDNRIVLDYGRMDDLILLGAVDNRTGRLFGPRGAHYWPGPRTETFPAGTLAEALAIEPRHNAEGLVVRYRDTGLMVKIKQDDYVRLHKLITGLSERSVWEHLSLHDGDYVGLLNTIPDEFHGWVETKAEDLLEKHEVICGRAHYAHHQLSYELGDGFERRDYAIAAQDNVDRPLLFMLLDGRDIGPAIWKSLKPFGSNPMKHISEDVA